MTYNKKTNMKSLKQLLMCALSLGMTMHAVAQIPVNSLSQTVKESFNTLSATGTSNTWTNNQTILGWYGYRNSGALAVTLYRADDGSGNAGGLYSFGESASDTNRALGSLASATTGRMSYGVRLKNNSGTNITQVSVKYTGKQWRVASTIANILEVSYIVKDTINGLTSDEINNNTGFVRVSEGDFSSRKLASTASKLNGNDAENQSVITFNINLIWNAGRELFLRWDDPDEMGSDHGMSLDDLEITFSNIDNAPPRLLSAQITSPTSLVLFFNEPLNKNDAETIANFTLQPTTNIVSANYNSINYSVTLQSDFERGHFYNLKVTNLRDSASTPNTLDSANKNQLIFNDFDGAGLFITELMYDNPGPDFLEFIELYNASEDTIELGGLKFSNSLIHVFNQKQLAPESFLVLARTKDSVDLYFGIISTEWQEGSLGNFSTNTTITLKNTLDQTLIEFTYENSGDWISLAAGNGHSLEFLKLNRNIKSGKSWSAAVDFACIYRGDSVFATPGYGNVVDSLDSDTNTFVRNFNNKKLLVYPNPAQSFFTIQNAGIGTTVLALESIQITDMMGRIIKDFFVETQENQITIHISALPSGLYNLAIQQNNTRQSVLIIKQN
jgi:hypothetical protein